MISIVVAYEQKRGIGANNDLLWQRNLPADLKHFKELTTGQAIIMGRRTYESIGRPLPSRQNIVVTQQKLADEGVAVVYSLAAAYNAVETGRDSMVIGGEQVFRQALPSVDRIYATEVQATFSEATVFFPEFDAATWLEVDRQKHSANERNKYDYDLVIYDRIDRPTD